MVKTALAEFLLAFKLDISSSLGVSLDSSLTKMGGQMVGLLEKYDVGVQSQFNAQQAQLADLGPPHGLSVLVVAGHHYYDRTC